MKRSRLFTYLFLFCLLGCAKPKEVENQDAPDSLRDLITVVRKLESSEVAIGKNICESFAHKESSFRSAHIGRELPFMATEINCGDTIKDKEPFNLKIRVSLNSSSLSFENVTYRGRYFNDIQTNLSSPLDKICPDLLDEKVPDNIFDNVSGVEKVKVRFLKLKGYPSFQLTYYNKDTNGDFRAYRLQESLVHTGVDDAPKYKGIVVRRTEVTTCPTVSSSQSLFRQTLNF